jgi:hypothetical protein
MPTLLKTKNHYFSDSCEHEARRAGERFGDLPNSNRGFNRTGKLEVFGRIVDGSGEAVTPPSPCLPAGRFP